jgi:hypothetical protein
MKIRKPRVSAYIRGPKIGPVHTVAHLGSVGPGSGSSSPARTSVKLSRQNLASLQPACAEIARKVAACATISQRVAFRAAFEKTADPCPACQSQKHCDSVAGTGTMRASCVRS